MKQIVCRWKTLIMLPLISLLLVSCSGGKGKDEKKGNAPVPVDITIATITDITERIEVNGTVLSQENVDLYPESPGRIIYLNMPDGAMVTQGTLLAQINDAELQAELEQLKSELSLAEKTEKRYNTLLTAGGIDQATYDAALNHSETLKARIKAKQAQIDKTMVKAPFTGRLGLRQISTGAFVSTGTLLGTLHSDDTKIDFSLPEKYEQMVKAGNRIEVTSVNQPEPMHATITACEASISPTTRNLKVRARLDNGRLSPGSFVKVTLLQSRKGILVPTHAIIPEALSSQLIVVKNGSGVYTDVQTGIRNAGSVEITGGIAPGDSIVVNGVLFVRPGNKVKVDKILPLSDRQLQNDSTE